MMVDADWGRRQSFAAGQSCMAWWVKMVSFFGILEYQKFQITITEVSVFRFQVSAFLSLFLTPET
jgi:hypothetical protein